MFYGNKEFNKAILSPRAHSGSLCSMENEAKYYSTTTNGRNKWNDHGYYWVFGKVF